MEKQKKRRKKPVMTEKIYDSVDGTELKNQLAQFGYDIFIHALARYAENHEILATTFSDLSPAQVFAWKETVWALQDLVKTKRPDLAKITEKQKDSGFYLYSNAKAIMKNHAGLVTYSKFTDGVKNEYRDLAAKIHAKIEDEMINET